jgi:hypothetical protein
MKIEVSFDNINFVTLPDYLDIVDEEKKTEIEIARTKNNNLFIYRNSNTATSYLVTYNIEEAKYNIIKQYDINNCNSLIFIKLTDNNNNLIINKTGCLIIGENLKIIIDSVNDLATRIFNFELKLALE